MIYTEKQKELLRLFKHSQLKRLNILQGSIRSGKTWISLVLWAFWVGSMPKDAAYIMTAKTLTSLKRNCLDLLETLIGRSNFVYSISQKEAYLFGRKIYLEGANDARSESKIRGMTLQGAYCDELTQFPQDFFAMLLSRLSEKQAKLFATTNPDNPNHWLKTEYIDRQAELDLFLMQFLIDDNTTLDAEYVKQIKAENTGVFYDRFILGKWVSAEGAIYRQFADNPNKYIISSTPPILFAVIGVDFGGNKSAHSFTCTGFTKCMREVVILDEFYLKKEISPSQLEREFADFVKRNKTKYRIYEAYCDSAETTLIQGFKNTAVINKLGIDVRPAIKSEIIGRIRFFNMLMSHHHFYILNHCTHTIYALKSAVWDSKSIDDKRLDDGSINIDSLDSMEYSAERYMKQIIDLWSVKI